MGQLDVSNRLPFPEQDRILITARMVLVLDRATLEHTDSNIIGNGKYRGMDGNPDRPPVRGRATVSSWGRAPKRHAADAVVTGTVSGSRDVL